MIRPRNFSFSIKIYSIYITAMPERSRRFRPGSGRVTPENAEKKKSKADVNGPRKKWPFVLGGVLAAVVLAAVITLAVVLGTSSDTSDTVSCGLFVCQAGGGLGNGPCDGWATECDGIDECLDGEDEANCTSECYDVQLCRTEPEVNEIEVAEGCVEDLGRCKNAICDGCSNETTRCCGPTNKTRASVICDGETYQVEKIMACGCRPCDTPQASISGKVTCNSTDPCVMTFRHVGVYLNQSNAEGDFGLYVDFPEGERLVLTISDETDDRKYFSQDKIINIVSGTSVYFVNIKMALKPVPRVFSSTSGGTFDYGDDGKFSVDFTPDSITSEDGTAYNGQVKAYVGLIDPTSDSAEDAPSELVTPNDDVMLSASMMRMSLEGDGGQSLNGQTSVSLDADSIPEEERSTVQFWDFSAGDGWNVQSNLTVNETDPTLDSSRRKRSTRNRLFGAASIRVGRELCNFDSVLRPYCFLKVRVFKSREATEENQLRGAEVFVVLQRANGAWMTFQRRTTWWVNGVCLQVPCNDALVSRILLSATYRSEPLYPYSKEEAQSESIGVPQSLLDRMEYRRSDGLLSFTATIPDGTGFNGKGPVYPSYYYHYYQNFFQENNYASYSDCYSAPFSDNHFRFYRDRGEDIENNIIPIDEENIFSPWVRNILAWWQNRYKFEACYIKVRVTQPSDGVRVKVVSASGTHPIIKGSRFGDRQSLTIEGFACVEFKCSGTLIDGRFDQTYVTVSVPEGDYEVGDMGTTPLFNASSYVGSPTFSFLWPGNDVDGEGVGIYVSSANHPLYAKSLARNKCVSAGNDTLLAVLSFRPAVVPTTEPPSGDGSGSGDTGSG